MPSLVMEFIGTIGQSAPHQRRDRVDHHPKFVIGSLRFVDGFSAILRRALLRNIGNFVAGCDWKYFGDTLRFRKRHEIRFTVRFRSAHDLSTEDVKFSLARALVSNS